ncbi:hypothetical protein APHNP_1763 [Anaplasma phagocytophilum str. ApNP]|uniref:Uncharacterized protein n=1 Tax=Anaplasma phagocytophilum str. ApNP TaxID=1359153 RepID=A0A0F3NGF4_ANAPH|nr:hypothetical protein APHNP_1763 [Anaplasma phagocytophilum str. ApNP]
MLYALQCINTFATNLEGILYSGIGGVFKSWPTLSLKILLI